ncbi:hypothetical protein, partial [Streptomyces sp. MBT62]|uniref:hypothetical protein n=1 Tax=Streptomyces sp. MBT62 TaxID=2800410 RepID=UPI00190C70C4
MSARPAPLPAGGQTHTPAPAASTSTSTPTPAPKKQQSKKSGPPKSGTSSAKTDTKTSKTAKADKNDKTKKSATGKNTSTSTGTSKDAGKSAGLDKAAKGLDKSKSPDKGKGPDKDNNKATVVQPPASTGGTTTTTTPASPYVAPTGNAVPTPGDGNCLLYAVIGSAPHLVRTHLQQANPAIAAGTAAWLARPDDVRQTLRTVAGNPQTTHRGAGHLQAAQQGLQNLVLARLAAAGDGSRPLPAQVLGQLRGVLAGNFTRAVQGMSAAQIDNELVQYGIQGVTHAEDLDPVDLQTRYLQAVSMPGAPPPPAGAAPSNRRMFAYLRAVNALPTLTAMTPAERRSLLIAGYHRSTAPLTTDEADVLEHAVENWSAAWAHPVGDTFLPLLADTLGAPIHVFQPMPAALAGTTTAGGPRG